LGHGRDDRLAKPWVSLWNRHALAGFDPHILERADDAEALSIVDSLTVVGHVVDGLVIFELEKCHRWEFSVTAACVVAAGRHFGCRVEAMTGDR